MGTSENKAIPRWAAELPEGTWERINELLAAGFDTPDVMRELGLPDSKLRSLQEHARKFGPRRRLIQFAKFKDCLVSGAVELGPEFAKALALVAKYAVSEEVKPSSQKQAVDAMIEFTKVLTRWSESEEEQEAERRKSESGVSEKIDPAEVARRMLAIYGVQPAGAK